MSSDASSWVRLVYILFDLVAMTLLCFPSRGDIGVIEDTIVALCGVVVGIAVVALRFPSSNRGAVAISVLGMAIAIGGVATGIIIQLTRLAWLSFGHLVVATYALLVHVMSALSHTTRRDPNGTDSITGLTVFFVACASFMALMDMMRPVLQLILAVNIVVMCMWYPVQCDQPCRREFDRFRTTMRPEYADMAEMAFRPESARAFKGLVLGCCFLAISTYVTVSCTGLVSGGEFGSCPPLKADLTLGVTALLDLLWAVIQIIALTFKHKL
jgi:FtsH-binding integral membrane protein